MMQKTIIISARPRGMHSITSLIRRELDDMLKDVEIGMLHVFLGKRCFETQTRARWRCQLAAEEAEAGPVLS